MDNSTDKDTLIEALLQERDQMYLELSKLREIDKGALENAEATIKKKDELIKKKDEQIKQKEKQIERKEEQLKYKEDKIKQLTDQLAWYRRKFWKASSEKYIPQDPNQRRIDFEGLDVLP